MNLIELDHYIDENLSKKLIAFELLFDYPLGETERFRIDHSPHFTSFYEAMGSSKTLIVESHNMIIASISASIKNITLDYKCEKIAYIGDLKIHPNYQSGRLLYKIIQPLQAWLQENCTKAYSIVMNGTKAPPHKHTGRLGIPFFEPISQIHILRFEATSHDNDLDLAKPSSKEIGYPMYKKLSTGNYLELCQSEKRSSIPAQWFTSLDNACGMLDDTRLAKRLYLKNNEELKSSHLSYFSFEKEKGGVSVIQQALKWGVQYDLFALFVALTDEQMKKISPYLSTFNYTNATATIYATDRHCINIPINTAEI